MTKFREKRLISDNMPDTDVVEIAYEMIDKAREMGFSRGGPFHKYRGLTFYMGKIPARKLSNCGCAYAQPYGYTTSTFKMELTVTTVLGVEVVYLNDPDDDERLLILEDNTPFSEKVIELAHNTKFDVEK